MVARGLERKKPCGPIKAGQLQPDVVLLTHEKDTTVLPAFSLPPVVKAREIFLIMRCENGMSGRCGEKVEFVILPFEA